MPPTGNTCRSKSSGTVTRASEELSGGGGAGPPGQGASEPTKALRVLVMEDDALIAMLCAEILAGMGHEVCAVEDSQTKAVAAAIRCRPDVMIVDARLREGSGILAVEEILRTGFVPHVFVCGDALEVQATRPGAVVIQKPYSDSELGQAIRRAVAAPPAGGRFSSDLLPGEPVR